MVRNTSSNQTVFGRSDVKFTSDRRNTVWLLLVLQTTTICTVSIFLANTSVCDFFFHKLHFKTFVARNFQRLRIDLAFLSQIYAVLLGKEGINRCKFISIPFT